MSKSHLCASDQWDLIQIKKSPGKGLGIFARQPIPAGTCILNEKVLVRIPPNSELSALPKKEVIKMSLAAVRALTRHEMNGLLQLMAWPYQHFHDIASQFGLKPTVEESIAVSAIDRNFYEDGLWLRASRFNHSCMPNTHHSNAEDPLFMQVYTRRKVEAGEELTTSYLDHMEPSTKRREKLRTQYGIDCTCEACIGPITHVHDRKLVVIAVLEVCVRDFIDDNVQSAPEYDDIAFNMIEVIKCYISFCMDQVVFMEELVQAYMWLGATYCRAKDAYRASWSYEEARKLSELIRGSGHPITRICNKASKELGVSDNALVRDLF